MVNPVGEHMQLKQLFFALILFSLAHDCLGQIFPAQTSNVNVGFGLTHYWTLGEGMANTLAYDSGPNAPDSGTWTGTKTGSVGYYSAGNLRQWAGKFDGSTNYITTAFNSGLTNTTPFSISVWCKPSSSTTAPIFSNFNTSSVTGFQVSSVNTSGVYTLRFIISSGSGHQVQMTTVYSFPVSVWHHIVATYDGSQTLVGMKMYVDNVPQSLAVTTNTGFGAITDSPWVIGSNPSHGAFFPGLISDVRTYNYAISQSVVAALEGKSYVPALVNGKWHIQNGYMDAYSGRLPCWLATNVSFATQGLMTLTANSAPNFPCLYGNASGVVSLTSLSWTSGSVYSDQTFLYGTFEASIQFGGDESHGTFWLTTTGCQPLSLIWSNSYSASANCNPGAQYAEIDVGEQNPPGTTVFVQQNLNGAFGGTTNTTSVSNITTNYHQYKAVWSSTQIVFSIDGTVEDTIACATYGCSSYFIQPMAIVFTDMLNSAYPPNAANFPQTMSVQYVRHCNLSGVLDFDDEFGNPPAAGCN